MIVDKYIFEHLFHREHKHESGADIDSEWSRSGFRAVFGVWDYEAAFIWNNIDDEEETKRTYGIKGWKPKYLLDALFFMKGYVTERQAAVFCNRDEKSLRKWNWRICKAVAGLDWVRACML